MKLLNDKRVLCPINDIIMHLSPGIPRWIPYQLNAFSVARRSFTNRCVVARTKTKKTRNQETVILKIQVVPQLSVAEVSFLGRFLSSRSSSHGTQFIR